MGARGNVIYQIVLVSITEIAHRMFPSQSVHPAAPSRGWMKMKLRQAKCWILAVDFIIRFGKSKAVEVNDEHGHGEMVR